MANVLGDPRKFDEAISAYNTILSINRRSVKAYIRLCQTYLNSGEYNRASDNCITATDLDQDSTEAWRMLGEVRYRLSQYTGAIQAFGECWRREQDQPPGRRQPQCWTYHGLAYVLLQRCADGLPLLYDVLIWSNDADAVRLANIGLDRCGGTAPPTPTPPITVAPTDSPASRAG
jgi:tetratricopeptide (TPR) repeat protein